MMDMQQLLAWLGTAGAGVIAYWIIEHWWWADLLDPKPKTIVAAGISGLVGIVAWLVGLWMGWHEMPVTPQDWAAALVGAALLAAATAEGAHTFLVKGNYTRDDNGERVLKN